jgi:hypothetical protein
MVHINYSKEKHQRQLEQHFNVSPIAIHKRLKKILPKPKGSGYLTDKEQKFAVSVLQVTVIQGKSRTQAAWDSFDVSKQTSPL